MAFPLKKHLRNQCWSYLTSRSIDIRRKRCPEPSLFPQLFRYALAWVPSTLQAFRIVRVNPVLCRRDREQTPSAECMYRCQPARGWYISWSRSVLVYPPHVPLPGTPWPRWQTMIAASPCCKLLKSPSPHSSESRFGSRDKGSTALHHSTLRSPLSSVHYPLSPLPAVPRKTLSERRTTWGAGRFSTLHSLCLLLPVSPFITTNNWYQPPIPSMHGSALLNSLICMEIDRSTRIARSG